ncbi:hypothetical protein [Clostridium sp. 1xD42-85]|uniref:hypothetical protein n=1 Tax=Clostridium sp. 1xD42-85 TaxID=2320084 RepID=UPI0015FF3F47|nr:hypothetical protein [Clostridium sp. 1xD42-85]
MKVVTRDGVFIYSNKDQQSLSSKNRLFKNKEKRRVVYGLFYHCILYRGRKQKCLHNEGEGEEG